MKKLIAIIIAILVGLFTYNVLFPVISLFAFGHNKNLSHIHINENSPLINKSEISRIDSFSTGSYSSGDEYRQFWYQNKKYYIIIWKFYNVKNEIIDGFSFEQYSESASSEFPEIDDEVLNLGYKPLKVSCSFFHDFEGAKLKFGNFTKIQNQFQTDRYKGFIGTVDKMCIVNKNGEPEILFNYFGKPFLTLFVVYKKGDDLYFVIVTPTDGNQLPITKDMINIFNLE